jgi:hypothetical protein
MTESPPVASRLADLVRFYEILAAIETKIGSPRKLSACSGQMDCLNAASIFSSSKGKIVRIVVTAQG